MEKPPKGITVKRIYKPDEERMVEALRILLNSKPNKKGPDDNTDVTAKKTG